MYVVVVGSREWSGEKAKVRVNDLLSLLKEKYSGLVVVTDKYAEQLKEDVEYRQEWAEKVGLGFTLGTSNAVPMKGRNAA